ncbi:MAG: hypothetical protein FJX52_04805, partial [Alphaproteobacteria bacterium]|nr:hypothetical protein [Alphaproteobacteria bacterium]
SYDDQLLECRIDNGNHLLLSGNDAVLSYLAAIGAADSLTGPARARFSFVDLADQARWTVALSPGRLPLWVFEGRARVPATTAFDYLRALALAWSGPDATVADILSGHGAVYRRLWQPFAVAALNTEAERASARLLWRVMGETFGRGGAACRPLVPRVGLSESLVDPAIGHLARHGMAANFGVRLRRMALGDQRVDALELADRTVALGPDDGVVLAVPVPVASDLVPDLIAPTEFRSIINAHYRVAVAPEQAGEAGILGVLGGLAEWIFIKKDVVSVTVSAADRHIDRPAKDLAALIWQDVTQALRLGDRPMPVQRIVKERRATFAATPEQLRRRPPAATRWRNLLLAGDWTDCGLPSTIEGAVRSGQRAAQLALTAM